MMTSHINNVLKQAITTFTCKADLFCSNLQILSSLLDKTMAEDVNFHPQFMTEVFWTKPGKAPVTCINIYEDSNITMGIFILKPGGKLPLHNHPQMHGLIKVIAGKVKITSYSLNTEKTNEVDWRTLGDEFVPNTNLTHRRILTAEFSSTEIVDTTGKSCLLEPNNKNLHEIESIEGPAAFLDILAPPYSNVAKPNNGARLCSYYSILSKVSSSVFRLHEIRSPSWYWTDECPYTGPKLVI